MAAGVAPGVVATRVTPDARDTTGRGPRFGTTDSKRFKDPIRVADAVLPSEGHTNCKSNANPNTKHCSPDTCPDSDHFDENASILWLLSNHNIRPHARSSSFPLFVTPRIPLFFRGARWAYVCPLSDLLQLRSEWRTETLHSHTTACGPLSTDARQLMKMAAVGVALLLHDGVPGLQDSLLCAQAAVFCTKTDQVPLTPT